MDIEDYRDRVKRAGILYVDVYPFLTMGGGEPEFLIFKRRDDVPLPSSWQPACGKIKKDETIRSAFSRQVCKKTGEQPVELYRINIVNVFYDDFYDTVMMVPAAAARLEARDVQIDPSIHCDHRWVRCEDIEAFLEWPKQVECIRAIQDFLLGNRTSSMIQRLGIGSHQTE